MRIPLPFLALLGLSAAVGAEANLLMAPSLTRPVAVTMSGSATRAASAAPFASDAWWLGFQDDTLNALILAARHHASGVPGTTAMLTVAGDALALPLDMQVAAAYVSAKVDSIGIELIREAMAATRREAELMAAGTLSEVNRSVLQQRMADAVAAERTLLDRRAMLLALLSTRCGMGAQALEALVIPALAEQRLPQFTARLPEQPPMDWVFERQDVVVAHATAEISAAVHELQAQHVETAALEAQATNVRRSLEDALARQQDGSGSELDVLERYQQLMLYSQQFSSASGALALGWIKLLYRLQGALGATADGSAWPASQPPSQGALQRPLI